MTASANAFSKNIVEVSCVDGNVRLVMHWSVVIGKSGDNVRHLFFGTSTFDADEHVLMRVQPDRVSTGITNNSKQAKAIILSMLNKNREWNSVPVEVFPEGRDEVNGEWEELHYSFSDFKKDVEEVASKCKWDLSAPIDSSFIPTVHAGADFEK